MLFRIMLEALLMGRLPRWNVPEIADKFASRCQKLWI